MGRKVNEQTHEWSAFLGWLLTALSVLSGEQKGRRLGDQLGNCQGSVRAMGMDKEGRYKGHFGGRVDRAW